MAPPVAGFRYIEPCHEKTCVSHIRKAKGLSFAT